jgi:hypothetical protein
MGQMHKQLIKTYDQYKVDGIKTKRFKSKDLYQALDKYKGSDLIEVQEVARSMGDKPINLVKLGSGKTKVLLWSQMHGNESTATMSMIDILRFLTADDHMNEIRQRILSETTIYMLPLLNPDGGDRFERRNNLGVDINRDAVRLQTPEAIILMETRNRIQADFGFNLHDQSRRNGVGRTGKPASISFLAPAFNYEKDIDDKRKDAMQLISVMINALNHYIPGQIGKYSDDFEPRAFGDNFQKLGTRTILIESGHSYNDDEKQYLRKMNYLALMEAFIAIANKSYKTSTTAPYDNLPFNSGNMADLVIRNIDYELGEKNYLIDIAYTRSEKETTNGQLIFNRRISDVGDLRTTYGYTELDAAGMKVDWGKTHAKVFSSSAKVTDSEIHELLRQGVHTIFVRELSNINGIQNSSPIRILKKGTLVKKALQYQSNPAFYLTKNQEIQYLITNGKAWEMKNGKFIQVSEK